MTQAKFITECQFVGVAPEIALENDLIVEALQNRDDALVLILLLNQF